MEHHLDFNNKVLWTWFDGKIWVTETIFNTWLIMIFLTCVAVIVRMKLKKFSDVPSGFQNFIELIVESMDNFVIGAMGEKYAYFGNWFFGIFVFIITCNYAELLGLRPPTADLATTVALGLSTFLLIHGVGIIKGKGHYFKEYFEPTPIFLPIHLMSALATPVSLSFRLFGNILGGFIIFGLLYGLFPWFLKIGIPAPLHIFFHAFVGAMQAFIFTVLSMTFVMERIPVHTEH